MGMNNKMQAILFQTNKFCIEQGSYEGPKNIVMAMTMNKNLEAYGYTLDAECLKTLATQTASEMSRTWRDLTTLVYNASGATQFQKAKLFYPNFPEEVMYADEAQLYLNSLFYYIFSQHNDKVMDELSFAIREMCTEEKEERLPLMETFPKVKVINIGTEKDLFRMMNARIHGLGMSESQLEELKAFSIVYRQEFDKMLDSEEPFQSKENKVKVAFMLRDMHRSSEIKFMMKDAVDVLRYAAMLSKEHGANMNNVELREKRGLPIRFKLNNAEKREIRSLLNGCKHLYTDIWRQEKLFKRLMKGLNPTEDVGCPARVVKAFDNLANKKRLNEDGTPIYNFEHEKVKALTALNTRDDASLLEKLAAHDSGSFLRNYCSIVKAAKPDMRDAAIEAVRHCATSRSIPLKNMLTVVNTVRENQKKAAEFAQAQAQISVFRNKNGKHFVKTLEEKDFVLTDAEYDKMAEAVRATAVELVRGYQKLGNTYVDPALRNDKAPGTEMRGASGGSVMVPHSVIPFNLEKNLLVFGINWGQVKGKDDTHIDVDLSVHAYSAEGESLGYCSYSDLRSPGMCHSGDYVNVPVGGTSTEAIAIDIAMMKQRGIAFIVPEVHCYSIDSFRKAGNAHFVMQQREGSMKDNMPVITRCVDGWDNPAKTNFGKVGFCKWDKGSRTPVMTGEIFEPAASECNILLNSDSSATIPCICDLENSQFLWLDMQIDSYHRVAPSVTEDPKNMSAVLAEMYRAKHSVVPSMQDLFLTYAEGNGTLVDDITLAETVFIHGTVDREKLGIAETANVITSLDLDVISQNYSGNNDLSEVEPEQEKPAVVEIKREHPLVTRLKALNKAIRENPNPLY